MIFSVDTCNFLQCFNTSKKESVVQNIVTGDTKEPTVSKSIQTIVDGSSKRSAEPSCQTIYQSQEPGRGTKFGQDLSFL